MKPRPRDSIRSSPLLARLPGAIEDEAAVWATRCDDGLNAADRPKLAAWLAADPRHEEAFARLTGIGAVFDRARTVGAASLVVSRLEARAGMRRTRRRVALAAGTIAMAMILGLWMRSTPASIPTPPVADLVRKLPDGSIVELNKGAEIAVQYHTAVRRVRLLRGEAHFRVAKNTARPFIVEVDDVEVRAVGTAFVVQLRPQAIEVVVTEGRVAVEQTVEKLPPLARQESMEPTVVDAGTRLLVSIAPEVAPKLDVTLMTPAQIDARLAWRVTRLEFNGTELAQAIEQMNRHNQLQIFLGDVSLGRLKLSGVFSSDNPEGFARILASSFNLVTERRSGSEIVLHRSP